MSVTRGEKLLFPEETVVVLAPANLVFGYACHTCRRFERCVLGSTLVIEEDLQDTRHQIASREHEDFRHVRMV
jgi:hypothetical protein